MNTIGFEETGEYIDPYGGIQDIKMVLSVMCLNALCRRPFACSACCSFASRYGFTPRRHVEDDVRSGLTDDYASLADERSSPSL